MLWGEQGGAADEHGRKRQCGRAFAKLPTGKVHRKLPETTAICDLGYPETTTVAILSSKSPYFSAVTFV
jgi:hypothetical protein